MTTVSNPGGDSPIGADGQDGQFVLPFIVVLNATIAPFLLWLEDKDVLCLAATATASLAFQLIVAGLVMRVAR